MFDFIGRARTGISKLISHRAQEPVYFTVDILDRCLVITERGYERQDKASNQKAPKAAKVRIHFTDKALPLRKRTLYGVFLLSMAAKGAKNIMVFLYPVSSTVTCKSKSHQRFHFQFRFFSSFELYVCALLKPALCWKEKILSGTISAVTKFVVSRNTN